ncbi:extracellular solute-binding protein [Actinophytocola sp.]|uniref:extracellular solute-binding protein n=1 Tax=Actinophytocola sp. TaxID=1872138 RepID=UPI002D7EE4DA|nr:extracellular solute-binding protein [Actinophytocola sp.]HET9137990.1 extracellular solute-binding protein [Actinophytocola sp.]
MTAWTPMPRRTFLGALGAGAAVLGIGGCSSGDSGGNSADPNAQQTIDWWHIANTPPMLPVWDELAKAYMAQHSNVKINITPIENEAFKAKMTTETQSGHAPSLFHTWGGGVLKQQVDAGLVKEITNDASGTISNISKTAMEAYQIDGKAYALPNDIGMVGFWYNKALFSKAGISTPPATWAEMLDSVGKLKGAGVTPIAIAGQAKWPEMYWWTYLAIRIAGVDGLRKAAADKKFDGEEFVKAGQELKKLVDMQPFQNGFLAAPYDQPTGQAATMGNGLAAMELMGQWGPSVQKEQSGKGIGDDLDFFAFPAVDGGKGKVTDIMGGGGGFAVGKDAPPATVDFLQFLLKPENIRKGISTGSILPVVKGTEDAVSDANAKKVVAQVSKTTEFQLYPDQAYPPSVGAAINDSVSQLVAGAMTPEAVAKAITEAAQNA